MILTILAFLMGINSILKSKRDSPYQNESNRSSKAPMPPGKSTMHDRALRGSIISRDNFTIAKSNKRYEAKIYPFSISQDKEEMFIKLFSIYSGIDEESIKRKMYDRDGKKYKHYVTLSKNIDAITAIYLKSLARKLRRLKVFKPIVNRKGVTLLYGLDILEKGEIREYPFGDTLTPAVGYVRTKLIGKYKRIIGVKGLEKRYEKYLSSEKKTDGLVIGKRDVGGTIIRTKSCIDVKRKDGYRLYLNVALDLQKRVEMSLDEMKRRVDAKEIIASVMDSRTGNILTIASSERFNPNSITKDDIPKLQAKFIEYLYEPGSVIKPITLSIALEHKYVTPKSLINTHNGVFPLTRRYRIRDDEPFPHLSATDVIVHSSNIGISEIVWKMTAKEFYDGLNLFELGKPSGVDLPRDLAGRIKSAKILKNRVDRANQSYGYGMQTTFMQLLKAYSVFNNSGVEVTPKIVKHLQSPEGQRFILTSSQKFHRVLSEKTAEMVKKILKEVVKRGTGKAAKYEGLEIGGKTGTAHIYSFQAKRYVERYNSSFFGFANDDQNHKYTIGILVIEPTKVNRYYFASKSAVPTFRKILDNMVELGYLKPNLSEVQKREFDKIEKRRKESAKRKQRERTKKTKELLKRQRERGKIKMIKELLKKQKERRREEKRKEREQKSQQQISKPQRPEKQHKVQKLHRRVEDRGEIPNKKSETSKVRKREVSPEKRATDSNNELFIVPEDVPDGLF
jgi:cell division protein FtsI (penicillin-binding protein 3)